MARQIGFDYDKWWITKDKSKDKSITSGCWRACPPWPDKTPQLSFYVFPTFAEALAFVVGQLRGES